jgi:hypothetical protein
MSSYYDCPACKGIKTMHANKNYETHVCKECGFRAGCSYLAGFWSGFRVGMTPQKITSSCNNNSCKQYHKAVVVIKSNCFLLKSPGDTSCAFYEE